MSNNSDVVPVEASAVIATWLERFETAYTAQDRGLAEDLFATDGWWRDLVALSWDIRTWRGTGCLDALDLLSSLKKVSNVRFDSEAASSVDGEPGSRMVSGFFRFDTDDLACRGHLRLREDADSWRAWTFLTQAHEIPGHTEAIGHHRPRGPEEAGVKGRRTWPESRAIESEFLTSDPHVLVIGGGHSGLAIAARLGRLDVPTLIVERNPRVGDNWRNRYASLTLHDPVWIDALPYMPFPSSWPIFTPKDKFGDWLESYAKALDLNVWASSEVQSCERSPDGEGWVVVVRRGSGELRTIRPKEVVIAMGLHGAPRQPVYAGQEAFAGEIMHASKFGDGRAWAGKRALVVGAGTSAHDISMFLWEQDTDVTMLQRSSTCVLSHETFLKGLAGLFDENTPQYEESDIMLGSMSWDLFVEGQAAQLETWRVWDKDMLDGLAATNYKIDWGPDDKGPIAAYLDGSNGAYPDVGALSLVADGSIKVQQGVEIASLSGSTVHFSDGSSLDVDLIVNATGYGEFKEAVRHVIGDVVDGVTSIHVQDDEGELTSVWRPTEVEGLWFMVGNLQMARFYSRLVALQIKARQIGMATPAAPRQSVAR